MSVGLSTLSMLFNSKKSILFISLSDFKNVDSSFSFVLDLSGELTAYTFSTTEDYPGLSACVFQCCKNFCFEAVHFYMYYPCKMEVIFCQMRFFEKYLSKALLKSPHIRCHYLMRNNAAY